ncbi:MAG: PEP-CTERM sorting domain-containing protein [Gemmatales bacterium]
MLRMKNIVCVVVLICLGWMSSASHAQITGWTNAAGGVWNTSGNWSAGVPNAATGIAEFQTVTGSYTVTFSSSPSNQQLRVYDGNITFNMVGQTYSAGLVSLGQGAGGNGRLTITNGTVTSTGLDLGTVAGGVGALTVTTGGTWNMIGVNTQVGDVGTGTLTINNGGTMTNSYVTLGSSFTGVGTLNVSGLGSSLSTGGLNIGSSGLGTATISGGAVVSATTGYLANGGGSTGTLTVTGSGSALNMTGVFTIGNALSTQATMTISSGGSVSDNAAILGSLADSSATVTVTGVNSTWSTVGQLTVGTAGSATLNINAGGKVTSGNLFIGNSAGSVGAMSVNGAGSSYQSTGNLVIGSGGTGSFTIGDGANVIAAGNTTVTFGTGTLVMNGGTLDTVNFSRNGVFAFNDGTLHVRGVYTPNPVAGSVILNGPDDASLPTLRLSGNFATNNVTNLIVGNNRQGALIIDSGRSVALGAQTIALGALPGSSGQVTLTGAGSMLTNSVGFDVGGAGGLAGGAGTLTLSAGTTVTTGMLSLHPQGLVNLNGGTLNLASLNANGGSVNFVSGKIGIQAATTVLLANQLDTLLGTGHFLSASQTLASTGDMTFNAPVNVTGGSLSTSGSLTNNSNLTITDGTLVASSTLTNNSGRVLQLGGTGSILANIFANNGTLLLNNNLVPTIGGTLTNTGTIRGTGYVGNNLTNGTAGQVQMTTGNRLEFQGGSNTNNGLVSLTGGELVFTGPVTNSAGTGLISGRDAILRTGGVTNNGSIAVTTGQMDVYGKIINNIGGRITISAGAIATFWDDVTIAPGANSVQASAAGGFVSRAVFYGSYNGGITGGGAAFIEGDHRPGNSPGLVTFDGDLFYGGLSTLHMEIAGITRGVLYDAIDVMGGNISINGALDVRLLNGFVPQFGDSFLLVNNRGSNPIDGIFTGLPEGSHVFSVGGEFSITYQGGNGNDIVLTAVPEPATWAMMGMTIVGAGGAYWYRRRKLILAANADWR